MDAFSADCPVPLASLIAFINAPGDYALLLILCITAAAAVSFWLCGSGYVGGMEGLKRRVLIALWGPALLIPILGWFLVDAAGDRQRARLRSGIEGLAPTYAAELSRMGHASINTDTPPDDPAYEALIAKQILWLELNPSVADIYTFRKHPDGNMLIVDSETDYNRNGRLDGEREHRTDIGEVWEEFDEELEAAYAGEARFDDNPFEDRWGTWVSAYVPMRDETGAVEAVLGVDYSAKEWVIAIQQARLTAIGALGFLVTIVLFAGTIITVLRAHLEERRRSEEALVGAVKAAADANEALAVSNRELEQFAYVASHDLQEPLRMVTGFLRLLKKQYSGKLDTDGEEYIEHAVEGANRMRRLINGLLELSRVGRKWKDPVPLDADAALEAALHNLSEAIKESGARVTHSPLPRILGDETQLIQVFQNLVSNAIKFCRDKTPEIEIAARPHKKKDAVWWEFSVRDNGPGIPREQHARVFQIFQRLHSDHEIEGTGIGLAMCRQIIGRNGGQITLESEPGKGSVFRFTLLSASDDGQSKS